MKYNDLMQVVNAVKSMNENEISLIIDAIKQNRKRTSVLSSTQFSVGQKVMFGKPRNQLSLSMIIYQKELINGECLTL